jgi:hypothetical protein
MNSSRPWHERKAMYSARFVATAESVDRDGEVIRLRGLRWERYSRNPVVLLAHQNSVPIGTSRNPKTGKLDIELGQDRAWLTCHFQEETQSGKEIAALVRGGFMGAASIGMENVQKRGREIVSADVTEWSIVAVPSCPTCLRDDVKRCSSAVRKAIMDNAAKKSNGAAAQCPCHALPPVNQYSRLSRATAMLGETLGRRFPAFAPALFNGAAELRRKAMDADLAGAQPTPTEVGIDRLYADYLKLLQTGIDHLEGRHFAIQRDGLPGRWTPAEDALLKELLAKHAKAKADYHNFRVGVLARQTNALGAAVREHEAMRAGA